jgi:deazaflavin-dependent oxidoreductase (nitroreductase family)
VSDFNDRVIAEFRANGGRVDSAGFGSALVLVHTRGARTGLERVNPAMSLRDGEAWLVVASAMGAARDPAWAVNLRAHPDVVIEVAGAGGVRTVPVTAQELDGAEYDAAFARFVRRSSAFAAYQDRATTRRLPVIRLAPRADSEQLAAAAAS